VRWVSAFIVALLGSLILVVSASGADAYPRRAVRLIVPYPPGGAGDIVGRMLSARLTEALGQQVVVDNRGGAAGAIACEITKRATPDGYTLLQATVGTLSINPELYPKLPYDPARDFRPVTMLTSTPYLLVTYPGLPARSVRELVALVKSKPHQFNFASGGVGTANHFSMELLKLVAGLDIVHVPYKGTGQAVNDVLTGQVQMMFMNLLPAMVHVKAGRMRGLAVTSAQRSAAVPDIPTIAESGFPGYESTSWHGIVVPAKTPAALVRRLHDEFAKITRSPDVKGRLESQGAAVIGNTPEEFAATIKAETVKWTKVIRTAGIKAE
jgi:tripartite-type tricarboxylate transporter receptor subunit TctC